MSLPLIQQANSWVGLIFSYIVLAAIYYSNTWNVIVTFVCLIASTYIFFSF